MAARKKVGCEECKDVGCEVCTPTVKKYRCDFNSYDEYNKYKGPKG